MVPSWEDLVADPPLDEEEEEIDPAQPKRGWQKKATWVVDSFPALDDAQAALLRSQTGPMASATFVPSIRRHASTPNRSGCSSCAVCGSHCLCNRVPTGRPLRDMDLGAP